MLRARTMTRHRMPSGTVRWYHGSAASLASVRFSFGVTDLTKPTSSWSGFGLVTRETRMEKTMSVSYTHLTLPTIYSV